MRTVEQTETAVPETQSAASGVPPRPPTNIAGGSDELPPSRSNHNLMESGGSPNVYVWLLRFIGLFMFAVAWGGHFLLLQTWPGPIKLQICTILGIASLLHSVFGRSIRVKKPDSSGIDQPLTLMDAVGVTALMIATGAFLTWLAFAPPL